MTLIVAKILMFFKACRFFLQTVNASLETIDLKCLKVTANVALRKTFGREKFIKLRETV